MTPEKREQVVELLRKAVVIADAGHLLPLLAAAVESNVRHTPIYWLARNAVDIIVANRCGLDAKPDRFDYPAMLRRAALDVEEGRWP